MPAWSAPTCLLPNGKVFFAAGPSAYGGTRGGGPSHFYEYNMQTEFPELDEVANSFTNCQELRAALCHSDGVAAERTGPGAGQ